MKISEDFLKLLDENKNGYKVIIKELLDLNKKSVLTLTERETYIIRKRYGVFDNGEKQTIKSIADLFHLSVNTIREDEASAVRKLMFQNELYTEKIELSSPIIVLKLSHRVNSAFTRGGKKTLKLLRRYELEELEKMFKIGKLSHDDYLKELKGKIDYINNVININTNYPTVGEIIELLLYKEGLFIKRVQGIGLIAIVELIIKLKEYGFNLLDENYLKSLNLGEDYKIYNIPGEGKFRNTDLFTLLKENGVIEEVKRYI